MQVMSSLASGRGCKTEGEISTGSFQIPLVRTRKRKPPAELVFQGDCEETQKGRGCRVSWLEGFKNSQNGDWLQGWSNQRARPL